MASATSNPPPPELPGLTSHFKPTAAVTITIIITTSVVATFFFLYCRRRRIHRPHLTPSWRPLGRLPTRGLDPEVLASFPALVYSDVKAHKHPLECAVCLSEFEDRDTLTLLPRCDHAFHPDCIAMWLASHVTCPVCRLALDGEVGGVKKATAAAEVVVADGPQVAEEEGRVDGGKRWWSEEERERFRLVLPEDVWREVLAGRIGRSASARGGWEERRRSYLRWDRAARSEHWGTLGRTLSGAWSRHGGGEAVAALVAESSTSSLHIDAARISTGSAS